MATYHDLEKLKTIIAEYEAAKLAREHTEKLIRENELSFYITDEEKQAIESAHEAMERLETELYIAGQKLAVKLSKTKNLTYQTQKLQSCS